MNDFAIGLLSATALFACLSGFLLTITTERMKASELRIGNLVANFLNEVVPVNSGMIAMFETDNFYGFKKPEPIPLTEDWFKSAGSEMRSYNTGNSKGFKFNTNKGDLILIYWKVLPHPRCHSFQVFIDTKNISEIEYVHQLQNLYFALTGEELKFEI